jgi:hypothetical protein
VNETNVVPLSKSARKRRRKSPLYRSLRDLLGADGLASQVANLLFQAGITTPEELCRTSYVDVVQIQGIGRAGRQRIHAVRSALQLPHHTAGTVSQVTST